MTELATWIYTALLALLRVLLMLEDSPWPNLWPHTALLYSIQWVFTSLDFLFQVLDPGSSPLRKLQVIDLALTTSLALIAISTVNPKGKIVVHQAALRPSPESLSCLASIATFGWADGILWRGNKKTFGLNDLSDLRWSDQADHILQSFAKLPKRTRLIWRLMNHFKRIIAVQMFWSMLAAFLTFAPTLLLQAILQYTENPQGTSRPTAWLYVSLLAVSGCVYGIAEGQAQWTGRRNGMQMETILVGGNLAW